MERGGGRFGFGMVATPRMVPRPASFSGRARGAEPPNPPRGADAAGFVVSGDRDLLLELGAVAALNLAYATLS